MNQELSTKGEAVGFVSMGLSSDKKTIASAILDLASIDAQCSRKMIVSRWAGRKYSATSRAAIYLIWDETGWQYKQLGEYLGRSAQTVRLIVSDVDKALMRRQAGESIDARDEEIATVYQRLSAAWNRHQQQERPVR